MLSRSVIAKFAPAALLAVLVALPGCSINVKDKNKDGEERVDIKTPVGNIHVDEQVDISASGLSLYPGAKPAQKEDSGDKRSANVNISGPGFGLKVVAGEFLSEDSSDKVLSYYSKELQKFGKVVECHGHWNRWNGANVGHVSPDSKNGAKPVACSGDEKGTTVELKVGTEDNQHIVAVEPDGKRTKFALVYVRAHGSDDTI